MTSMTIASVREYYNRHWNASGDDVFTFAFRDAIEQSYEYLGGLQGKKMLEIGCGSGEQAVYFASQGTKVTVIDLSSESIKITQKLAEEKKVTVSAMQMNAEQLDFPSDSFDFIYINSTLMHVDKLRVLQECSRILKKEGKLVIVEPLQYALFVQIYRLFSSYRKMKPRYATLKMFKEEKKCFSEFQHKEFYFLASLFLPMYYFKNTLLHKIYGRAAAIDSGLLRIFPWLRKACWVSVVQYKK